MSARPAGSLGRLSIAIVVAGIVIAAALFASSSLSGVRTSTVVVPSTTTVVSKSTETWISLVTTTGTASPTTVTTTVTTTSTSTVTSTTYPFVAPVLRVQLNSTHVAYHGGLAVTISLTNVLPYNLSFVPSLPTNSSIPSWNERDFNCGSRIADLLWFDLFGFAVFEGHYTTANLTSAAPLTLNPPLLVECLVFPSPYRIVFLPNSTRFTAYSNSSGSKQSETEDAVMNPSTGDCVLLPAGYDSCSNGSLFGYWNWNESAGPPIFNSQEPNTSSKYFSYFPAGEYTLVVQDLWGVTVFSYFQVATVYS